MRVRVPSGVPQFGRETARCGCLVVSEEIDGFESRAPDQFRCGCSSVGQNAGLSRRRSRVRAPSAAPIQWVPGVMELHIRLLTDKDRVRFSGDPPIQEK